MVEQPLDERPATDRFVEMVDGAERGLVQYESATVARVATARDAVVDVHCLVAGRPSAGSAARCAVRRL
ncbi:hypothetical protein [Halobaculum litoreum]|uniref:hypothetical protein n=1 Tax=Halobaculum litoreum TaxID=3031998 RepID=UPI0024C24622|nr:hypothetical protein [Halobaculum sp. DT92]